MSVQNDIGYKPVNLGVKLPDGTTYWLSPKSRKALKAEVDTLARKIDVDAKALRQKLFASIEKEGMEFPADHTQNEIHQRKLRSAEAADIHAFVAGLFDYEFNTVAAFENYNETFNSILATLKSAVGEDSDNKKVQELNDTELANFLMGEGIIEGYRQLRKEGGDMVRLLKEAIDFNESRRQDAKDRRRTLIKKRRHRKVKPKAWAQTRPSGFTPRSMDRGGRTKKSGTHIAPKGVALSVGMDLSETNRGISTSISCRNKLEGVAKATKPLTKAAFLLLESETATRKKFRKEERQEAARKRRAKRRKNGKSRSARAAAVNGGSGESAKKNNAAYGDNC